MDGSILDRQKAQSIIAEIKAINPASLFFKKSDGRLGIDPMNNDQFVLLRMNEDLIIEYLKTPPDITGICTRRHKIDWGCTQSGTWVCRCFFLPYDRRLYQPSKYEGLRDYWIA